MRRRCILVILAMGLAVEPVSASSALINTIPVTFVGACRAALNALDHWLFPPALPPDYETLKATEDGEVTINNIAITGAENHPLELVLKALLLNREKLKSLAGKKILSLGEGFGALLPYLLTQGLDIQGLDLWYHTTMFPDNHIGKLMAEFNKTYSPYLIRGNALELDVPRESYDEILGFKLSNNIRSFESKIQMLDHVLQALNPGGEFRDYGWTEAEVRELKRYQRLAYLDQIQIDFQPVRIETPLPNGKTFGENSYLVIMTKPKGVTLSRQPYKPRRIPRPEPHRIPFAA